MENTTVHDAEYLQDSLRQVEKDDVNILKAILFKQVAQTIYCMHL